MNISTYLPEDLLGAIDRLARERHVSRSAIIREAVEGHLARYQSGGWPDEVLAWTGDAEFPPFEAARKDHSSSISDPFEMTTKQ